MTFHNPDLRWLGFLALLPLLIFLFYRQRYRVMPWAAMAFLARAVERNRRRLRIQNLLLLLLRILGIAALVAAVSRPELDEASVLASSGTSSSVLFVFDASYSMAARYGTQTAFDVAKDLSIHMVAQELAAGDRVGVVVGGKPKRVLYASPLRIDSSSRERIGQDLKDLRVQRVSDDVEALLAAALAYLPRFNDADSAGPVRVVLLTDLQRSGLLQDGQGGQDGQEDSRLEKLVDAIGAYGHVQVVDCGGGGQRPNVGIVDLSLDDALVGADVPVVASVRVRSWAEDPMVGVTCSLFVDGVLHQPKTLTLEPGEERVLTFTVTVTGPGAHVLRVELGADRLDVDNVRYFAILAREAVEVLLVDGERGERFGEGETDFLALALAPMREQGVAGAGLVQVRVIDEAQLEREVLDDVQVIVLANVAAPSEGAVAKLAPWVERGGGLVLGLGHLVDAKSWNERLLPAGLLPGKLGTAVVAEEDDSAYAFVPEQLHHPVLRPFALEELRKLLVDARFTGYLEADAAAESSEVLASFRVKTFEEDGGAVLEMDRPGSPAFIESRHGRGRVLLFASAVDGQWSNFFIHHSYLIFWQGVVSHLASGSTDAYNVHIGEALTLSVPALAYAPRAEVLTPSGARVITALKPAEGVPDWFQVGYGDTADLGVYSIRVGQDQGDASSGYQASFAVNAEVGAESDLSRVEAPVLRRWLGEKASVVEGAAGLVALREGGDAGGGWELWRALLWLVLGLLVVESVLASTLGRRARPAAVGGV